MISGGATARDTTQFAQKHAAMTFHPFGRTQWLVSQAGFGGYRVSAGIKEHYQAMVQAIDNGVNLIDTSTNYADGGSEQLVGQVLDDMISNRHVKRGSLVVVSKVGYLQGRNFVLSQERKQQGRPFPDLVPYADGLEHCIHPEFIEDQLTRSLDRLGLKTLDLLLLHNPEYYLSWAGKQNISTGEARKKFYQRIGQAFDHLEKEVARGRIQAYGISANTFPASCRNEDFLGLDEVWPLAEQISKNHHFRAVQFPMNLFESGAALEENQRDGQPVLSYACTKQLGVLVNRPMNAFSGNRLVRLADVEKIGQHTDDDVIQAIGMLNKSEKHLWRKVLPALNLPTPLYRRIKEQAGIGDQLKHHWRNFGHYERWRQFKDGLLWPHMQGVFDFLESYAGQAEALDQWLASHPKKLKAAVRAVGSVYVSGARREIEAIRRQVGSVDGDWDVDGSFSQQALRAVRSTLGVTTVLVGMRRVRYVDDVVEELRRPVAVKVRTASWHQLRTALSRLPWSWR
jgi:aryl-alcohol dehydrogenase-like predicted oxidoreductase